MATVVLFSVLDTTLYSHSCAILSAGYNFTLPHLCYFQCHWQLLNNATFVLFSVSLLKNITLKGYICAIFSAGYNFTLPHLCYFQCHWQLLNNATFVLFSVLDTTGRGPKFPPWRPWNTRGKHHIKIFKKTTGLLLEKMKD